MTDTLILFNGLQVTDHPPGQVGRYKHLRAGSWVSARLLVYVFPSFPRLWSSSSRSARTEADMPGFQYNWRGWVAALEAMRKDAGAWAVLARYLVHRAAPLSARDVTDVACAVIELAMRDAEIERNSFRSTPRRLAPYAQKRAAAGGSDEQAFMSKTRSATGYGPRVQKIEKCIYRAIVWRDPSLVFRISQGAPSGNIVHSFIRGTR